MIRQSVAAVKMHDFVSRAFVTYLGFFEGIILGFTKNLSGSSGESILFLDCRSSAANAHLELKNFRDATEKRSYKEAFLVFGFTSVMENSIEKPCAICFDSGKYETK